MALVNRQDYFDRALDMLAEEGYGGLRLTTLCNKLGVTSGSFYNWFAGWDDFVEQFLAYWRSEQTETIAAQAAAEADPHRSLETMRQLARAIPHRAEVAFRAWSDTDPRVQSVQREVDRLREEALYDVMAGLRIPEPTAGRLARLSLSIVVGHEHIDPEGLDWSIAQAIALIRLHADSDPDR